MPGEPGGIPRLQIAQQHSAVRGPGSQGRAIARERHRMDRTRVLLQGSDRLSSRHVPQSDRGILPPPAEARVSPLGGENDTERTSLLCPLNMATRACVAASHSLTVGSDHPPAEARSPPSGKNATEATQPVCPSSVATSVSVATSHSRTVPSLNPDTSLLPSGEKATERVPRGLLCTGTSQVPATRLDSTSHSLIT